MSDSRALADALVFPYLNHAASMFDEQYASLEESVGGPEQLQQQAAAAGLTPQLVRDLARTRALIRRGSGAVATAPVEDVPQPAAGRGLRIDVNARRIWVGDVELAATTKEFDVLALLDVSRGAVVHRERLISEVWDENWFGSTKTLDVTIGRLRSKLEAAEAGERVVAIRGVGFRLETGTPA